MSQEEMLPVFSFVIKVMDDGIRKSLLVNFVVLTHQFVLRRLGLTGFHPLQSLQPPSNITSNNECLSLRKGERGAWADPQGCFDDDGLTLQGLYLSPHDPQTANSCM